MIRTRTNGKKPTPPGKQRGVPGRLGIWHDSIPERAFRLCLLGLTNADLAIAFGVSPYTIEEWLRKKPEFSSMVRAGKTEADANVAYKLYQRACGYKHKDVDIKAVPGIGIIKTEIEKIYPPDPVSAIFWLKNRTKKNVHSWADVNRIEHTGEVSLQQTNIDMKEFTMEELRMMKSCGLKVAEKNNGQSGINPSAN